MPRPWVSIWRSIGPPVETFLGRVNKTVILNATAEAQEEAKVRKLDVLRKPVMAGKYDFWDGLVAACSQDKKTAYRTCAPE